MWKRRIKGANLLRRFPDISFDLRSVFHTFGYECQPGSLEVFGVARRLAPITETHLDRINFWDHKKNPHVPQLYTYGKEDVVH